MTIKSIIDIDVQDGKFRDFWNIFQQYNAQLSNMPDAWGNVSGSVDQTKKTFGQLLGQTKQTINQTSKLAEYLAKSNKVMKDFGSATVDAGRGISRMAKDAKSLASSLGDIGKTFLKIGALGAAVIGTPIWALDKLGQSAVSTQRSARGLGLNPGQVRAFNLDFGRYVDPSVLNKVSNAQGDASQIAYLAYAAGVSVSQAQNMGTDQLAIKTLINAHNWWNSTPANMRIQQSAKAQSFMAAGLSWDDIKRSGNTPLSDLTTANAQYMRDSRTLNVSNSTTSAWYQLTRQLSLAGQMIETNLTKKLQDLGPALGNISMSFAKDINALVNNITPQEIEAFANGIKSMALYMASPEFIKNLKQFADAMMDVARAIIKFEGFITNPLGTIAGNSKNLFLTPFGSLSPPNLFPSPNIYKQASSYAGSANTLDITKNNPNWERSAPTVKMTQTLNRKSAMKVNVSIMNKTGSDLYTSSNAMVF